jgi:hypothetical protein
MMTEHFRDEYKLVYFNFNTPIPFDLCFILTRPREQPRIENPFSIMPLPFAFILTVSLGTFIISISLGNRKVENAQTLKAWLVFIHLRVF